MRSSKNCRSLLNIGGIVLAASCWAGAADLPTAKSIAAEMGVAWNLGNTMEVPASSIGAVDSTNTGWGNPVPSHRFIDSIKAAGFRTVRIPCAWDSHANATTHVIDAAWMTQVKAVVDYAIKDSLFVVLNIHWDGGWLENRVDSSATDAAMLKRISEKQGAYWRQIATTFKDYGRHLLFASTNEPNVADSTGAAGSKILNTAGMRALNTYHQVFIDTVRATGGNNASRTLVVQGPSTNIDATNALMTTLPTDKIADRLMAEVHFYPYSFCLMEQDASWGNAAWYWGKNNHSTTDLTHNPTWGEEAYVDASFDLMKKQFVDKNIPVLIGELGAIKRTNLTGENLALHILSRRTWYNYVVSSALSRGLIPAVWDAGGKGVNTMTVLDRKTGEVFDLGLLNAIRSGAGLKKLDGDTSLVPVVGTNAMKILYSAKDSLRGQVNLGVSKPNFGAYDSILVRAYVNGKSSYDSAGATRHGFLEMNLVTMSGGWKWREAGLGTLVNDNWATYRIPISSKQADTTVKGTLVPADPTKVDFFALQAYSKAYNGTIYVDWIVFKTKAGVSDTVYTFDVTVPETYSDNVVSVTSIPVASVSSDVEWKTATTTYKATTGIAGIAKAKNGLRQSGTRLVSFETSVIRLTDLRGHLVRSSTGSMELGDLPRGIYLATDGAGSLHLPLAQ